MKNKDIDDLLKKILKDPFEMDTEDPVKEQRMKDFLENQKEIGLNMAVVMYMISAMEYFKGMELRRIKEIAIEIALQGAHGYDPNGERHYKLTTIPGKTFTGYHILAYYYVSFAIVMPEILKQVELPYDKEYKIAQTFFKVP